MAVSLADAVVTAAGAAGAAEGALGRCVAAVQRKRWKELWWKQVFPWGAVIGQGRGEFSLAFVLLVMGDESWGAGPVVTAFYYWSETDQDVVARGCPPFYFFPSFILSFHANTRQADVPKGMEVNCLWKCWKMRVSCSFFFFPCTFPLCLLSVSITFLVLTWANTAALRISYPLPERRSCKLGTPRQYFSPLPFLFLLKLQLKR